MPKFFACLALTFPTEIARVVISVTQVAFAREIVRQYIALVFGNHPVSVFVKMEIMVPISVELSLAELKIQFVMKIHGCYVLRISWAKYKTGKKLSRNSDF